MENDRLAPVLPLRDVVVYPHMAIPLFVGREKSIKALSAAMQDDKKILLVAQRTAETDDPRDKDIYSIGTLASILQLLKLPDNTVKVLVGPSTNGASIQGGQSRKVGPGDVIVIPPGVAHWFSAVEKDMNYLVVRVDADHVLPAGYVNPAVGKTSR